MDVYTYSDGIITAGDLTGLLPKKNCRIKINFPADASESYVAHTVAAIEDKTRSDILLHGVVTFVESTADSQLFPSSEYSLLVIPAEAVTTVVNVDYSAFEVLADSERCVFLLCDDSVICDKNSGKLIVRDDGVLTVRDELLAVVNGHADEGGDWVFEL